MKTQQAIRNKRFTSPHWHTLVAHLGLQLRLYILMAFGKFTWLRCGLPDDASEPVGHGEVACVWAWTDSSLVGESVSWSMMHIYGWLAEQYLESEQYGLAGSVESIWLPIRHDASCQFYSLGTSAPAISDSSDSYFKLSINIFPALWLCYQPFWWN
jgi:hypothetical protein